jgi:preprotein translocase subunit Sss1
MLRNPAFLVILLLLPFLSDSQIFIGFANADSAGFVKDSISTYSQQPDADRNDIPFIDYKPAIILNTPTDSVCDYAYIRKNFTDQMVSVWSHPKRLYPASRIYGIDMDGKHYRSVKVAYQNYVFAEQLIKGEMDLYMYRKIPQVNGWVEFVGHDSLHTGYRNNMIIEQHEIRGKQNYFGYYISIGDDTLRAVSASKMQLFADTYLKDAPVAKAMAMKFAETSYTKTNKIAVIGLMTVGILGLAMTGGGASLIFLAGFPAAILVAYINRPHTLHWEDMVEIVNTYNSESAGKR